LSRRAEAELEGAELHLGLGATFSDEFGHEVATRSHIAEIAGRWVQAETLLALAAGVGHFVLDHVAAAAPCGDRERGIRERH
jgi:hypothetical protein